MATGAVITILLSGSCGTQKSELLEQNIGQILNGKNMKVGVAFISDKDTFVYNNDTHYPMLSVFKFHTAVALLHRMDSLRMPLDSVITITREELRPDTYSPIRDKYPEGNVNMSIRQLMDYAIAQSDNNACDIMIRMAGGTNDIDRYIRSLGVSDFNIGASEADMHNDIQKMYDNWSTPLAAAELLSIFRNEKLFENDSYKEALEQIMQGTITGKNKIRAGVPDNAVVGDKTGSAGRDANGIKAADNDIAFVSHPDCGEYYVAIFITDSGESDKTNEETTAAISREIFTYLKQKSNNN